MGHPDKFCQQDYSIYKSAESIAAIGGRQSAPFHKKSVKVLRYRRRVLRWECPRLPQSKFEVPVDINTI